MRDLDRLGWAAGLTVVSHGLRIGIRTDDPGLLRRVEPLLPPGARRSRGPVVDRLLSLRAGGPGARPGLRRFHLLYDDATRVTRTHDLDELLADVERHLERSVAEGSPDRIFVHAGAVVRGGRALLIPGSSHSGKSTLVAALVRAGATYYSDEYAVLDARGRIHAFPRPLRLRGEEGVARAADAEAAGGPPVEAGLVAVTRYRRGARWQPRVLSPGQGLLALLAHTVPARQRPAEALEALRRVVSRMDVLEGARGEADVTAELLLRALAERPSRSAGRTIAKERA